MEPTTYNVTVVMPNATGTELLNERSALVVFSAVQGSDGSALPLVWLIQKTFGTSVFLHWKTAYRAYSSSKPIVSGTVVQISDDQPIAPGQTLTINAGPTGCPIGVVGNGGTLHAITIANSSSFPFTCGIEQMLIDKQAGTETWAPVCAYPLHGNTTQTITPLPRIVLMFTNAPLEVGEAYSVQVQPAVVIPHRTSSFAAMPNQVLLVDMAQAPQTSVTVHFDIDQGWSWGNATWAKTISLSQMIGELIQPDPPPLALSTNFNLHNERNSL